MRQVNKVIAHCSDSDHLSNDNYEGTEKKFEFSTLELHWKDNQKNISCIPSGTYDAFKRQSPSRGVVFELKGTGHRTHIQIHAGNYYTDILGCVLVGAGFSDINNDGFRDVYSSKTTLNKLLDLMPETFMITDRKIGRAHV